MYILAKAFARESSHECMIEILYVDTYEGTDYQWAAQAQIFTNVN